MKKYAGSSARIFLKKNFILCDGLYLTLQHLPRAVHAHIFYV